MNNLELMFGNFDQDSASAAVSFLYACNRAGNTVQCTYIAIDQVDSSSEE